MSGTATPDSPSAIDPAVLDELIPPRSPRWRRAALWASFLAIIAAAIWGALTGTILPKAETNLTSWGGNGPVAITVDSSNQGRSAIEITDALRPPPGLRLLGYSATADVSDYDAAQVDRDPFPIRIAPGQTVSLTAWYEVTDCQAIEAHRKGAPAVTTTMAGGLFSHQTSTQEIEVSPDPERPTDTLWQSATQYVCP